MLNADSRKIQNIHQHKAPLMASFEQRINRAKRNRDYLDKMEVSFKSNLICRSAGYEGCLDISVNRDLPTAAFDTRSSTAYFFSLPFIQK